ncbi:MAG: NYN domain-containing protein [Thermoanaerobaculia bacterium]
MKPTADEEPVARERPREKEEDRPEKPQRKPKSGASGRPKPAPKPPARGRKKPAAGSRPKAAGVRRVALLCDPESLTRGLSEVEIAALDLQPAIQRLLETGKIVVKRAYADREGSSEIRATCREAGFELIATPESGAAPGAGAGIQLAVDAMDLCHAKDPVDTFVLISGDGNLAPLVSKLKENNRKVLGVGLEQTSSQALVGLCDEYLFCDDIGEAEPTAPEPTAPEPTAPEPAEPGRDDEEAMGLMIEAIETLVGENAGVLWGSVIKQAIQRKLPTFAETDFGFSSFSELLEEAERRKLIKLKKDERSGTFIVTGFSPR